MQTAKDLNESAKKLYKQLKDKSSPAMITKSNAVCSNVVKLAKAYNLLYAQKRKYFDNYDKNKTLIKSINKKLDVTKDKIFIALQSTYGTPILYLVYSKLYNNQEYRKFCRNADVIIYIPDYGYRYTF